MAKIAILVPFQDMCEIARPLLDQYTNLNVMSLEYIQTDQVEARAHELESLGCDLIVARGVYARIIRRSVPVPLVEIRVTAQELGRIVVDIRRSLGVPRPQIALVGIANMFCDTSQFNDLFEIDLRLYMVEHRSELEDAVERAYRDGCAAVIGGDTACACAAGLGMKNCFIPSGEESLRTALETASRVCYAIDLEKRNSAEMDTMLNYTFSGIMQVDRAGVIQRVNRAGYDLLGRIPHETIGHPVTEVLPNLSDRALQDVFTLGQEAYAFMLDVHHRSAVVNMAPISVDGQIEGAILTFQAADRITEMDSELRRELYRRGHIARFTFDKLVSGSRETAEMIKLGRRIAKYNSPVLLQGDAGSGKSILAQCIHNDSLLHQNAYVWVDCSAWLPETLDTMLFGNYTTRKDSSACMAELAQNGTLYLSHVEALPSETQYKVFCLIQGRFLHNGNNEPVAANVRVIASTSINLISKVEKGEFRSDLYYALRVLSLSLLPLRRRPEDIMGWVEFYLNEWQDKHKRYVHLTQGAEKFLQTYDWPGNLDQLNSVCERIVLLAEKRNVDETFVRRQTEQVTPRILPGTETVVLYRDRRAVELAELLRKHQGNREKVAAELGISKTTLWRRIKQYGIEKDFSL